MMTTTAQATGASSTVPLCGKIHRIRPMQEKDVAEFVLWCQDREMTLANRTAAKMEDRKLAAELIAHAHDSAVKLTTVHPDVLKMMLCMDGFSELLWYQLRDYHPDLSYTPDAINGETPETLTGGAAVRRMMMDPETLEVASAKYEQLNTPSNGDSTSPFVPKARKVKRKKRLKPAKHL